MRKIYTMEEVESLIGISTRKRNQRRPKRGRCVKRPLLRIVMMHMLDQRRSATKMEENVIELHGGSIVVKRFVMHPI